MTNLSIDSHVRITAGIHQGQTARVIGDAPEGVRVAIDFFGREMEVVIEHAHLSPETSRYADSRARVAQDCASWQQQLDRQFWTARSELSEHDPLADLRAYAQHSERLNADARQAKLLAEFDARFASVPDEQVDALFEAESQRWLPYWNEIEPPGPRLRGESFAAADRRRAAEAAGKLEALLDAQPTKVRAALAILAQWDQWEEEGSFPYNPDGNFKVFSRDQSHDTFKLRAYTGNAGDWRLVIEFPGTYYGSGGSAECACRVLSPGNNELRAHNFVDTPPEISADEEVAFLRDALFATPIYLEDPPRDLSFDAASAPWKEVFATTGADIVQHTQHGTRRAPSESAFYTKIAALLVG